MQVPAAQLAAASLGGHVDTRQQYLGLVVGNETYAVSIVSVREILELSRMTTLPMTPDFIRGVMNLRGAVVPVIDLNARFGHGASTLGKRSCIVIVEAGASPGGARLVVGTLVDAVSEVMELAPEAIEPPPPLGTRIPAEFIFGMARSRGQLYVVLNLARTLAEDEMAGLIAEYAEHAEA